MLAPEYEPMNLAVFQAAQSRWCARQPFAGGPAWHPLLGIFEEAGELAHAYLKQEQGIRGTKAQHTAAKQDAVGDILTYLADYCTREGFDLQAILEHVWAQVSQRDWNTNPATGDCPEVPVAPPAAPGRHRRHHHDSSDLVASAQSIDHALYARIFDPTH